MTGVLTNRDVQVSGQRQPVLLLVEDHEDLRTELSFQLRYHHMIVLEAATAAEFEAQVAVQVPDVLVLDINLPDRSGFSIATEVKQRFPQVGIVMLTARATVDDRVLGFEVGADIYMVKPVDFRELHACIKSLFARLNSTGQVAQWQYAESSRMLVSPEQKSLELTALEALTLKMMLQGRGSVCSRQDLHEALGFSGLELNDIRLNTLISRLRRRLSDFSPELRIVTWRNKGYAYVGPPIVLVR